MVAVSACGLFDCVRACLGQWVFLAVSAVLSVCLGASVSRSLSPFKVLLDFTEGPCSISLAFVLVSVVFFVLVDFSPLEFWAYRHHWTSHAVESLLAGQSICHKISPKHLFWVLITVGFTRFGHAAPVPTSLGPRDAGDRKSARLRDVNEELPTGRPVLQQTQAHRERLLANGLQAKVSHLRC